MGWVNFATATLDEGIAFDATSLTLRLGQGARFNDGNATNTFYATIWDTYYPTSDDAYHAGAAETVQAVYTSGSDVLTITRAQDGTTAVDLNGSGREYEIFMTLTKAQLTAIL